jgi:hypothetical protein
MTIDELMKLREWVKAEIEYAIFDKQEDSEGYIGTAYAEKRLAEQKFKELYELVENNKMR